MPSYADIEATVTIQPGDLDRACQGKASHLHHLECGHHVYTPDARRCRATCSRNCPKGSVRPFTPGDFYSMDEQGTVVPHGLRFFVCRRCILEATVRAILPGWMQWLHATWRTEMWQNADVQTRERYRRYVWTIYKPKDAIFDEIERAISILFSREVGGTFSLMTKVVETVQTELAELFAAADLDTTAQDVEELTDLLGGLAHS